jgi:hypothetical protein
LAFSMAPLQFFLNDMKHRDDIAKTTSTNGESDTESGVSDLTSGLRRFQMSDSKAELPTLQTSQRAPVTLPGCHQHPMKCQNGTGAADR